MKIDEWKSLSEEDQMEKAKHLNPYEDWDLFKSVENDFLGFVGDDPGVSKVFCGVAGTVGGLNAISVRIVRGGCKTKFPKYYLGFPVLKSYESQTSST